MCREVGGKGVVDPSVVRFGFWVVWKTRFMRLSRCSLGSIVRLAATTLFLALGSGGCFTYHSLPPEALRPGVEVRTGLSETGMQRVSDLTGRPPGEVVQGTVVALDPDGMVLELWRTDRDLAQGRTFNPGRVEVPVALTEIVSLEEKRLSRARTGVLAATAGAGLFLLLRSLFGDAGGGLDSGPSGPDIILSPTPWDL